MLNEGNIWGNPPSTNSGVGWGRLYILIVWSHIALKFLTLLIICKVHDGTCHIQYMEHGSIQLEIKGQKIIIICSSTQLNTCFSYVKILGHIHLIGVETEKKTSLRPTIPQGIPIEFHRILAVQHGQKKISCSCLPEKKKKKTTKTTKTWKNGNKTYN